MYLALILFCILFYLLCKNKANKSTIKHYIITITVLLIAVSGLRHEAVGNDTFSYIRLFDKICIVEWGQIVDGFWEAYINPSSDAKDPGQFIIIKALSYISSDSRMFLFIVAAILLIPLGIFVYRNSESLETPCFFYVFYITMFYPYLPNSAVRQSLALAMLIIGFLALQKRKVLSFLLVLFMATFVHKSVIIAALIIPFYYIKNTRLCYKLCLLLFVFMLFYYQDVGVFLSMQSDIYEMYGTGEYYSYNHSVPYMVILMILGLYFLGWTGINKDIAITNNRLVYGGAAMTLVWVVMVRLDPSVIRLTAYFGPWMGLMVPDSLKLISKRNFKVVFMILLLVFVVRACITPDNYHFLWQDMELHDRY